MFTSLIVAALIVSGVWADLAMRGNRTRRNIFAAVTGALAGIAIAWVN